MTLHTLARSPLIIAGAALLILGSPLAACGKLGELQKPSALAGGKHAGDRKKPDAAKPVETVDPRDHAIDPTPLGGPHIQSSGQNPLEGPGAFPNPDANPR
jgi:hypothetical protein